MALVKGELAAQMKALLLKSNSVEQTDMEASIDNFANNYEQQIYDLYSKITITIPSGAIVVQTAQGPGVNGAPIVIEGALT